MIIKKILFWLLAIVITLVAAYYQRITGPTYPKKIALQTSDSIVDIELLRTHGGDKDCRLAFYFPNQEIKAQIDYRRFPTKMEWTHDTMRRQGDSLITFIPNQPAAGKIAYKLQFFDNGELLSSDEEMHVVVRFKGAVPVWALLPHVLFIFLAMFFSNLTAIYAFDKQRKTKLFALITFGLMTLGGMIFGPIVQLHAFGELWTGIPFGWDLTDNKTLIAFIVWLIAVVVNRKKERYYWYVIAAIVTIAIFSIPHSMFGSELDYASGTIGQA